MPNTPKNFSVNKSRILIQGSTQDIQVPFDKVELSNGESILMYTVEGNATDVRNMPKLRENWHAKVACGEKFKVKKTQLECAREGIVTPEMEYVAIRESYKNGADMAFTPDDVKNAVARGVAVIPANINHPEVEPMIIGKDFAVKVNANIGASSLSSNFDEEIAKLRLSLKHGADTVMDLSTGIKDLTS